MSGNLGADIGTLPVADVGHHAVQSTGRFVCEVAPDDLAWFLHGLGEPAVVLGEVTDAAALQIAGQHLQLDTLRHAFKGGTR